MSPSVGIPPFSFSLGILPFSWFSFLCHIQVLASSWLVNAWDSSGQVFPMVLPGFPTASSALGFQKIEWKQNQWLRRSPSVPQEAELSCWPMLASFLWNLDWWLVTSILMVWYHSHSLIPSCDTRTWSLATAVFDQKCLIIPFCYRCPWTWFLLLILISQLRLPYFSILKLLEVSNP